MPAQRKMLLSSLNKRGFILTSEDKPGEAMPDWDRLIQLTEGDERQQFKIIRIRTRVRLGELEAAVAEAEVLVRKETVPISSFYDLACIYARAAEAGPTDEGAEAKKRIEHYAAFAVELLEQAYKSKQLQTPAMIELVERDRDLRAVRQRPDFQALLKKLNSNGQKETGDTAKSVTSYGLLDALPRNHRMPARLGSMSNFTPGILSGVSSVGRAYLAAPDVI